MNLNTVIASGLDHRSLVTTLRSVGKRVGGRSKRGRNRKRETELWIIRRYVLTLLSHGRWNPVCTIHKSERPDFFIETNSSKIGVEVTEASSAEYQRQLAVLEREKSVVHLDDGWMGDEPERLWCAEVVEAVRKKVRMIGDYGTDFMVDVVVQSNSSTDLVRSEPSAYLELARKLTNRRYPGIDEVIGELMADRAGMNADTCSRVGKVSVIDGQNLHFDLLGRYQLFPLVDFCRRS